MVPMLLLVSNLFYAVIMSQKSVINYILLSITWHHLQFFIYLTYIMISIDFIPHRHRPEAEPVTLMQNSDPLQFCHYNCIFVYIGYLTQTLILNMINHHSQVYLCFTNIAFLDPNSAPICASRKRSDACVTAPCTWNER